MQQPGSTHLGTFHKPLNVSAICTSPGELGNFSNAPARNQHTVGVQEMPVNSNLQSPRS